LNNELSPIIGLTPISHNVKTGPMPVSSSPKVPCPDICKLNDHGCYGETGPISFHWNKINKGERGLPWNQFLKKVSSLFPNTLWRHNQVGDLPHNDQEIDEEKAIQLTKANHGRKGFAFSHHDVLGSKHNQGVIKAMNKGGFTVNLSADTMKEADQKAELDIGPVSVLLPKKPPWPKKTPVGRPVLVCLNITHELTCMQCKLCQIANRKSIIGFPAHGTRWKKAEQVYRDEEKERE